MPIVTSALAMTPQAYNTPRIRLMAKAGDDHRPAFGGVGGFCIHGRLLDLV